MTKVPISAPRIVDLGYDIGCYMPKAEEPWDDIIREHLLYLWNKEELTFGEAATRIGCDNRNAIAGQIGRLREKGWAFVPAKARSTHAAPTAKTNAAGKKGGGAEPVKRQIVKSDADAEPAQLATQSVAGLVTEQIAADPNGLAAPPAAQLGSEPILIGDEMAIKDSAAIEREAFAGAIEPLPEQSTVVASEPASVTETTAIETENKTGTVLAEEAKASASAHDELPPESEVEVENDLPEEEADRDEFANDKEPDLLAQMAGLKQVEDEEPKGEESVERIVTRRRIAALKLVVPTNKPATQDLAGADGEIVEHPGPEPKNLHWIDPWTSLRRDLCSKTRPKDSETHTRAVDKDFECCGERITTRPRRFPGEKLLYCRYHDQLHRWQEAQRRASAEAKTAAKP